MFICEQMIKPKNIESKKRAFFWNVTLHHNESIRGMGEITRSLKGTPEEEKK